MFLNVFLGPELMGEVREQADKFDQTSSSTMLPRYDFKESRLSQWRCLPE